MLDENLVNKAILRLYVCILFDFSREGLDAVGNSRWKSLFTIGMNLLRLFQVFTVFEIHVPFPLGHGSSTKCYNSIKHD